MTTDDMELVRQYAAHKSESAFAALVARHANLVYSAALRQVGDTQLAEEITQAVFIILARKAAALNHKTILPSWLYRAACYTGSSARKQEQRRQQREQEAYMESTLQTAEADAAWKQMSPLLEEAMLWLGQTDRDALVLRFFEGRTLNEVGMALGASEDAAKKRVNRALEKLRKFFTNRGVNSTTEIIADAISANSVQVAPVALAKSVTAVAIAKGVAASGPTLTLIQGALKIMALTKMKTAIFVGVGILLAATTTVVVLDKTLYSVRDPVFQGRHLSSWLTDTKLPNIELPEPSKEAVRQLGTNSLPLLFKWLHKEEFKRGVAATMAYEVLGSSAAVQIPDIIGMLTNKTALAPIVRARVAGVLGYLGTEGIPAIPALIQATTDKEPFVRNNALAALGRIHQEPDLVIPCLIEGLNDPSADARGNAVISLTAYGTNAIIAIPAIKDAATYGQLDDKFVKYALEKIKLPETNK